jgi:hypothetical protein
MTEERIAAVVEDSGVEIGGDVSGMLVVRISDH